MNPSLLRAIALLAASASVTAAVQAAPGDTRVANWKDDKKSAFLIMLDDSVPTDLTNAIPELQKRGLSATLYINPGMYHYKKNQAQWENDVPKIPGMVLGNHTLNHDGLKDYESADTDLKTVNAVINKAQPGKPVRLISFAKPGVGKDKWTITDEDYKKVLANNNLIAREIPGLRAAIFNIKTADEMLGWADDGAAKGQMRAILFHGIGGDWLSVPMDLWNPFLDGLVTRKDQLWITDHISAHKYDVERKTAKVAVTSNDAKAIKLELKSEADAQLFDYPLTLISEVPATWKKVQVTQGDTKTTVTPANGFAQFEAIPNASPITLQAAN